MVTHTYGSPFLININICNLNRNNFTIFVLEIKSIRNKKQKVEI